MDHQPRKQVEGGRTYPTLADAINHEIIERIEEGLDDGAAERYDVEAIASAVIDWAAASTASGGCVIYFRTCNEIEFWRAVLAHELPRLICPHCQAEGAIVEVDVATRWNELRWERSEDGPPVLRASVGDYQFDHERFLCTVCQKDVDMEVPAGIQYD